jgi:hypothetical protein
MSLTTDGVAVDARDDGLDLEWAFWDKQLAAIDALDSGAYDVVVFRGGYGSGKSILGSRWIHETALAVPKSDLLVLAQDSAKGGPTTYKVFFEQLPGADTVPEQGGDPENSPLVARYKQDYGGGTLTYVSGATARLGSADKWNRYAGGEFNAIWADEVAHYETTDLYKLNRMLISRQRTSDGPNVTLWTSTGNGYNQFYDFVERQVDPDGEPLPTRIHNVVADSRANPFLDEQDKLTRQFEGTPAEEQGLAGGFAAPEGLVYSRFSRQRHVVPTAEARDRVGDWRLYGYDAGWDDPRVLLEIGRTGYDQYVVVDALYKSGCHVGDPDDPDPGTALAWLAGRPAGTIYSEHAPADIDQFRRAGWTARKAEKDIDGGIDAVRARLEADDEGRPGLLVADACTPLIQEVLSYQEEHVGSSGAEDHACFVAGTQVLTETGERPIETIAPGDRVLTRAGYQPVLAAGKTAEDVEVVTAILSNGRTLTATANHPVHTTEGFKPLFSLRYADLLTPTPRTGVRCQKSRKSNSKESPSGATQNPRIGQTETTTAPAENTSRTVSKPSTGRSGDTTTARFQTGTSSITQTATPPTTTSRTWSASRLRNMLNAIQNGVATRPGRPSRPRKTGINQTKGKSGTETTPENSGRTPNQKSKSASSVERSLNTTRKLGSAQTPVKQSGGESPASTMSNAPANGVTKRSLTTNTRTGDSVRVSALQDTGTTADVYNLSVFGQPEYFANGVLVHNCDALRYAIFTNAVRPDRDTSDEGFARSF